MLHQQRLTVVAAVDTVAVAAVSIWVVADIPVAAVSTWEAAGVQEGAVSTGLQHTEWAVTPLPVMAGTVSLDIRDMLLLGMHMLFWDMRLAGTGLPVAANSRMATAWRELETGWRGTDIPIQRTR